MKSKVNHQKKELSSKNNEIEIKNENIFNKYKSSDLLIRISPKNTFNKSNGDQIINSSRRTISKNAYLISCKKNKNVKPSCLSNEQLYEIKINNNSVNIDEKKNKSKDEKIFTFKNKEKNIELDSENSNNNNNQDNTMITKSDSSLIKVEKKKKVSDEIMSFDSSQEIDSIEEELLKLYKQNNIQSNKDNKKLFNNSVKNYKKDIVTGTKNQRDKDTKSNYNKQKIEKEKDIKKIEKKIDKDNQKENFEDIIINDSEFDNPKNIQNYNLEKTKFPNLSMNPFTESNVLLKKKKNKLSYPNQDLIELRNKFQSKIEEKEKTSIDSHIKCSTFRSNNKNSTTNSSNLSSSIELNNKISNNLSKKVSNNSENSISDIENNYKNLLLFAKRGDKQKFLEIFEQISSLTNKHMDINYKDENGYTALHYACNEGNLKIVEILLNANCDPNIKNNDKETPLHLASKSGYFDISKKLIENGALLDVYDSENNSPIHYVCQYNYVELLIYFLTKSPQIETKNIYGKKPIDLTTNNEIKDLLKNILNKNENKLNKNNIKEDNDCKKKKLLEKKSFGNGELNKDILIKNDNNEKVIDINKDALKKIKPSISPSSKNTRNVINSNKNIKNQFNSTQDPLDNELNIIIKNSISNNIHSLHSPVLKKRTLDKNNANINYINKRNLLRYSTKINETTFDKLQKEQNMSINKNSNLTTPENNNNVSNSNNTNSSNKTNNSNNLVNELKNIKEVDKFSINNEQNKHNNSSLNKKIKKGCYISLKDSKIINSKMNDSINNSRTKINLNIKERNDSKKVNKSASKFKKETTTINNNGNNIPQTKSKFFKKICNNLNNLESNELSNKDSNNLNKTEENINKNIKKLKTNKYTLRKSFKIKNINNNAIFDTTETLVSKIKPKNIQKKEDKKKKKVNNSQVNNCNLTKLSYEQNKNDITLDSKNKSNLMVDQTITDFIHNKLNLNSIEEERVTLSNFVCLAQLGKGSFGEVYLVQKTNSEEKYAMKVLRKERIMGQNLLKYAIAERNVLSLSHHPFIVKLNFAFQTSTKLFLILEYCPNGDLAKHLLIEKRFSEQRAKFYLCEVLLALENLHQRDIIFRDLKPDNVVLDSEGHCKLTDFGLSKEGVIESKYAQSFCGSIAYLAPEMLKKQGHGKAIDWYLLGVLFYEMLVGITPYFTTRKEEIFHNIECGELNIPDYVSPEAADLLRKLLERDPSKRLGGGKKDAQEIKEYPYFKDVDWDKVYNKEIKPPIFINYINKTTHFYHKPKLFANDDLFYNITEKQNPNNLMGWSFINHEEL